MTTYHCMDMESVIFRQLQILGRASVPSPNNSDMQVSRSRLVASSLKGSRRKNERGFGGIMDSQFAGPSR